MEVFFLPPSPLVPSRKVVRGIHADQPFHKFLLVYSMENAFYSSEVPGTSVSCNLIKRAREGFLCYKCTPVPTIKIGIQG